MLFVMQKRKTIFFIVAVSLCSLNYSLIGQNHTIDELSHLNHHKIEQFVLSKIDSLQIPGISIAIFDKDSTFYHKSLGIKSLETKEVVDANTLFEACSLTKPVFAYTVIKLSEKGVLDLDTPLYKYYPNADLADDKRYKQITARVVLSHTSGLPNWRKGKLAIGPDPGTEFLYSGEAYEYLGSVIEYITGDNLQDVILREVFAPLGIKNSYFFENKYLKKHMATGHRDGKVVGRNIVKEPHMAYSLCTNAEEYSKLIIAFMNESKVPNSTFNRMSVPHFAIDSTDTICLGIFTDKTPTGLQYYHSGNNDDRFTSSFEFYIENNIGYVYFINCNKRQEFTKELESYLGYYKSN